MTKDLTRGTPWKLILQFALPIMAGNPDFLAWIADETQGAAPAP